MRTNTNCRALVTYLPSGSLVYPLSFSKSDMPKLVPNTDKFPPYLTHHGHIVFIKKDDVSQKTFSERYIGKSYIFVDDVFLCANYYEIKCNNNKKSRIRAGWAGESEWYDNNSVLKLQFYDVKEKNYITGYINRSDLEDLENKGRIIDTKKKRPKHILQSKNFISTLSKKCGQEKITTETSKVAAEFGVTADLPFLKFFNTVFGVTASKEKKIEITFKQDKVEQAIKAFQLRILKANDNGEFSPNDVGSIYVTASYACDGIGSNLQEFNVEKMVVEAPDFGVTRKTIAWDDFYSQALDISDAEDIFNSNRGRPFLFSVNKIDEYYFIVDKIQSELGFDFSTSNLFLSAFNRSCFDRSGNGNLKRADCSSALKIKEGKL